MTSRGFQAFLFHSLPSTCSYLTTLKVIGSLLIQFSVVLGLKGFTAGILWLNNSITPEPDACYPEHIGDRDNMLLIQFWYFEGVA